MRKSGKGRGKQADKSRRKMPAGSGMPAPGAEQVDVAGKADPPAERAVDITKNPPVLSSPAAYLKSLAWLYPAGLLLIMGLMLYIRTVPSYGIVFTDWPGGYVNFASDDAVYHMRLVHETVTHFPERIFYDPFTHYPYGSMTHFGPLLSLLIAGTALVLGLGNPSLALVDTIGAFTPAIIGVLCAIPTYFLGRKLFGRNVGLLAAFTLAMLPGQFFNRSLLGFTDHHILEVLLSATTVAFMIYALDSAQRSGLTHGKLKSGEAGSLTALGFGLLAGLSLGLYILSWPGALLVGGFLLFIYFVLQASVDHVKGRDLEYLPILAAAVYLPPALLVLPYSLTSLRFEQMYYSITQPVFLCLAIAGVCFVYGLSVLHRRTKVEAWTYPVLLLGLGVTGMLALNFGAPQIYGLIQGGLQVFTPSGGMLMVQEAAPSYLNPFTGELDLGTLWRGFFWTLPLAVIGLVMLSFRVFRDNRPAEWLFFVWNVVMLIALLSQNRFGYYFAVNAALLVAYFCWSVFGAFDWGKFAEKWRGQVKTPAEAKNFISRNSGQVLTYGVLSIGLLIMITWPATSLSTQAYQFTDFTKDPGNFLFLGATEASARSGAGGINHEWYETLMWMRNNTPDPQGQTISPAFSYSSGSYLRPGDGENYRYPGSAYGVMSWWDYGHIITYVAHRIPNANPFQAGINENNGTGSAPFFLATTEEAGYANLEKIGSRYVVIENRDANGYIEAMSRWANDTGGWSARKDYSFLPGQSVSLPGFSQKYRTSMISRLYYQDCVNLSHFRLVYESPGDYKVNVNLYYPKAGSIDFSRYLSSANYTEAYGLYLLAINPVPIGNDRSVLAYDARPPARWVKVFEVVDGATIKGHTAPGTGVSAVLNLSTGDRTFEYVLTGVADQSGNYELTVPYATEAMNGTGYSSAVKPLGKYTLTVGDTTTQVDVPEDAIQTGKTITI